VDPSDDVGQERRRTNIVALRPSPGPRVTIRPSAHSAARAGRDVLALMLQAPRIFDVATVPAKRIGALPSARRRWRLVTARYRRARVVSRLPAPWFSSLMSAGDALAELDVNPVGDEAATQPDGSPGPRRITMKMVSKSGLYAPRVKPISSDRRARPAGRLRRSGRRSWRHGWLSPASLMGPHQRQWHKTGIAGCQRRRLDVRGRLGAGSRDSSRSLTPGF
jgi:hypothetical protein